MPDQDNQELLSDDAAVRDGGPHEPTDATPQPLEPGTSTVRSPNVVEETDRVPTAPNSQANFAENETPNPPEYKEPSSLPEVVTEERNPTVRELINTVQSAAARLSSAVASGNVTRQLMDEVNAELSRVDRDAKYLLSEDGGVTS